MYPSENDAIKMIKAFFDERDRKWEYTNLKGAVVYCRKCEDGIDVSCLRDACHGSFLPWGVFWHAVHILLVNGGKAPRGQANGQGIRLGDQQLPFHSVEGHVAHTVYGKQAGEPVFMRISPIAHILIGSGVCRNQRGDLELVDRP
jgi:hypothetical protein